MRDLEHIADYFAAENPRAAGHIIDRIVSTAATLVRHPKMGRLLEDGITYRLTVINTPYLIFYRLRDRVEILAVFHTARKWPDHLS